MTFTHARTVSLKYPEVPMDNNCAVRRDWHSTKSFISFHPYNDSLLVNLFSAHFCLFQWTVYFYCNICWCWSACKCVPLIRIQQFASLPCFHFSIELIALELGAKSIWLNPVLACLDDICRCCRLWFEVVLHLIQVCLCWSCTLFCWNLDWRFECKFSFWHNGISELWFLTSEMAQC